MAEHRSDMFLAVFKQNKVMVETSFLACPWTVSKTLC